MKIENFILYNKLGIMIIKCIGGSYISHIFFCFEWYVEKDGVSFGVGGCVCVCLGGGEIGESVENRSFLGERAWRGGKRGFWYWNEREEHYEFLFFFNI